MNKPGPVVRRFVLLTGILATSLALPAWQDRAGGRPDRGSTEPSRQRPQRPLAVCDAPVGPTGLTLTETEQIVEAAVTALSSDEYSVAVTDRSGRILAVWQKPLSTFENAERAVALARTGAFFSNDQAPLSSRTVRFISQKNYPPGIEFLPNGALYGIENTNRGCSLNASFNPGACAPPATSLEELLVRNGVADCPGGDASICPLRCDGHSQEGCGLGIYTGKYTGRFENGRLLDVPEEEVLDSFPNQVQGGGIPLFKDCRLVGGIGVFGVDPDPAEFAALAASLSPQGFGPADCLSPPFAVFLDGIRLPFVLNTSRPPGTAPGALDGGFIPLDRDDDGEILIRASRGAAENWLVGGPDSPRGSPELSPDEVELIVRQSIEQAEETRAAIRLPLGSRTRMAIAVTDLDGELLALFRMSDSTVFSVDVAVAKARNVVYFSGDARLDEELEEVPLETAVTNRTISFGSQPLYPPGITGSSTGPFFDLFRFDLGNPCSQGFDRRRPLALNGVVFFPGSAPLYKDGRLVGGLGISGDGVEQDDVVAAAGSFGFEAPEGIRADQVFVRGVRLPYLKFNRNPEK